MKAEKRFDETPEKRLHPVSRYLSRFFKIASLASATFVVFVLIWRDKTLKTYEFEYSPSHGKQTLIEIASIIRYRAERLKRSFRVRKTEVYIRKNNIHILVASNFKVDEYIDWLLKPGLVKLRLVHPDPDYLRKHPDGSPPEGYYIAESKETLYLLGRPGSTEEKKIPYLVKKEPELVLTRLESVEFRTIGLDRRVTITLKFKPGDAMAFARITASNVGRRLAFFIDEELCAAPRIMQPIQGDRVQIQGYFFIPKARRWSAILGSGSLMRKLKLVKSNHP